MLTLNLILAADAVVPPTFEWNPKVGAVMIVANIIAIAFAKATMKYPNAGPSLPGSGFFGGMGLPALLGSTSFGHILGVGAILGLERLGVL